MKHRKRANSGALAFNPKRRLREWSGSKEQVDDAVVLASTVVYGGNPAHKRDPGDFGLTPPAAPRQDATLCDDAGVIRRREAQELLRRGAAKGSVDARSTKGFPWLIWSVNEDGIAFEAELENADLGSYHGYPMPLSDPFRPDILKAYKAR